MRTKSQPAGRSAFRRTPLALALACAFMAPSAMAQFDPTQLIVTNQFDDFNPGSLRYAVDYANAWCDTEPNPVIKFAMSGTGPFTISPSFTYTFYCESSLSYNPTIDGTSQPGWTPNGKANGFDSQIAVRIDGVNNAPYGGSCALALNPNGQPGVLTLKGLEVTNWTFGGSQWGVCGSVKLFANRIFGNARGVWASAGSVIGAAGDSNRNVIANHAYGTAIEIREGSYSIVNNFIGLDDPDGIIAYPNNTGIGWSGCCSSPSGTISNNVLVNRQDSIVLGYDNRMTISGNKIGTDPTGTAILGNGSYGISLYYSYGASISDNVIAGQDTGIDLYRGGYVGNFSGIDTFSSANGVSISGNKIGTDASGNAGLGNFYEGIYDSWSYGTKIENNVISGNEDTGVYLYATTDTSLTGNFIGTDATGTKQIANPVGIYVGSTGSGGENNVFDGNLVSGNFVGIYLSDASNMTVRNNLVGTTAGGGGALGNVLGIVAECGMNLTFNGNLVSGNTGGGVSLSAIQNSVFNGNVFGGSIPNQGGGLELRYAYCGPQESDGKRAKTAASRAKDIIFFAENESNDNQFVGNTVSNNLGHGVYIEGGSGNSFLKNNVGGNSMDGVRIESRFAEYGALLAAAVGNSILETPVWGNGMKNINLDFDGGPLAYPAGTDVSGKPNHWQRQPVIAAATKDTLANKTVIDFSLDSRAGQYRIDFFSNPAPGAPAGKQFLEKTIITLASDGNMASSFTLSGTTSDNFSATATRVGPEIPAVQDTSEFSNVAPATTLPVPAAKVVPTSINFGDIVVSRSSGDSTITITSEGTGPYIISALRDSSCTGPLICSSGAFACSTSCLEATPYSAGTSCTITASFNPTALGSQNHTLALCDNTTASPRMLTFSGNGVPPPTVDIAMAPTAWNFGDVLVGAQSVPKTFRVSNAGSTQVYLSDVRLLGDFVLSGNTCTATLAAGASCGVDVTFAPAAKGLATGTVQVTGSNTAPAPASTRGKVTAGPSTTTVAASLQGNGLLFGDLRLPASISFGAVVLHAAPAQQSVELRNFGNGPLALGSMSVTGPFALVNGCGTTLAPGAACTLTLDFNPVSLGTFNGSLTVLSDAPGGSRVIALSAQVVADARPVVRVDRTVLGFGERVIGSESPTQRVTLTNEGAQDALLGPFTFVQPEDGSGGQRKTEFSVAGTNCIGTLAPQATCFADVIMKALGFGPRNGQMIIPSNSADSPRVVTLGGTGCRPFAAGGNRSGRDPCAP